MRPCKKGHPPPYPEQMGNNELQKSKEEERIEELNREMAIRQHDRTHEMYSDARKAAIDSAAIALRAMILVNGGAVVALLAFIGSLEASNGASVTISALVEPIEWFGWGVGLAVTSTAIAYLVNVLDSDILSATRGTWNHPYSEKEMRARRLGPPRFLLHVLALGLAIGSLVSFWQGVASITDKIGQLGL